MDEQYFWALFVDVVEEKGLARYGDQSKLGRAIFQKETGPVLWRMTRNGRGKTGKRKISIADMMRMSDALEERLSTLIFQVEERARMGVLPKERGADADEAQPGRKKKQAAIPMGQIAFSDNAEAVMEDGE